ncbi:TniQ family protein [Streptomyces ardesiacus]|uniref:TniQ family protein n=1 Tax=Streptomyces ardesiacus TaxID=285564 RepID=UPI003658E926
MTPVRTLPLRQAPLPGEALDSWIEALSVRLRTPLGEVMQSVGLPLLRKTGNQLLGIPPDWTILLGSQQAAALSVATGLNVARLREMTLLHYDRRALEINHERRFVNRRVLWGRGGGSRFCPDCLAESDGRWMLSWRLGWSFACLRHRRLLADNCPGCGRVPRLRPRSSQCIPRPRYCGNAPAKSDGSFTSGCGLDLAQTLTLHLPVGHPAMAAQSRIADIIESGTSTFGVYALMPQPAPGALSDIRALCGRVLSDLSAEDLIRRAPYDIAGAHLRPDKGCTLAGRAGDRPGFMAPARAVSVASAVTVALGILDQPDIHQAGEAMRDLLTDLHDDLSEASIGQLKNWGTRVTPVFTGIQLAAAKGGLRPANYLRHRMTSPVPRRPMAKSEDITRRSRKVPSTFWNLWTLRLTPPDGTVPRILAPALAAALLTVDSRTDFDTATELMGSVADRMDVSHALQRLDDQPQWPHIATALTRLADYLDTSDVPIDYARRRSLDYTTLLSPGRWGEICRRTGTHPGGERREQIIRCHLFQRISGFPPEFAPGAPTLGAALFRTEYFRFLALQSPQLAQALDVEAQAFLATRHIHDEPVAWQPPKALLDGLGLPGLDPDQVDLPHLHRLIRQRRHAVQYAADVLGTSVEAVRYLLGEHPAPLSPPTTAQGTAREDYARAMQTLPKERMARLYLDEHRSLSQISELTGFSYRVLTRLAREYAIPMRRREDYKKHAPVERDWLYDQYVVHRRLLSDLARERGMHMKTMADWARHHEIPLRHGGAPSAAYRAPDWAARVPASVRDALTAPYAWKWLEIVVAALPYATMRKAAQALGVHPSTLIKKINELERDLGHALIERAERGRGMRPTPFGAEVAQAVRTAITGSNRAGPLLLDQTRTVG